MVPRHPLLLVALLAALPAPGFNSLTEDQGERATSVSGGAHPAPVPAESGAGASTRSTRAASAAAWLRLMQDYSASGAEANADADGEWFPRPVPLSLPIGRGGASMPVLVLPVPVPANPLAPAECSAGRTQHAASEQSAPPPPAPPYGALAGSSARPRGSSARPSGSSARPSGSSARPSGFSARPPGPSEHPPPSATYHTRTTPSVAIDEPIPPHLDYIVSSQQLVELFRAQGATGAELPPVLIPDYTAGEEGAPLGEPADQPLAEPARVRVLRLLARTEEHQEPLGGGTPLAAAPPVPRFERSLLLRGELTVPRSGYTEPYAVWWEASSGAARVELHGGATVTYRSVLADGRVQAAELRTDRTGPSEVRRCAMGEPRAPTNADRLVPAFPDMQEFYFTGYSQEEFGRVELWRRTVSGRAGELGAALGEALTFRHEVVVARAPDNYTVTPLRYSVAVDSSVLGPDIEGYVHRYTELRDTRHEPALLVLDTAEACDEVETSADVARLDPLREYTLPHRDTRYDHIYQRFKTEHKRQYLDETEEAVRKTQLVQHSRFVLSGNRQGATFGMEVNYLGDRLDAEVALLRGVREEPTGGDGEPFPHSREQLATMRASLPRAFDWRQRGAVSHVRYQGSCSTCWAFAVAGAVEGALFVRTRRLVPLSEQCLVDCAHPYGGHGCGRTWPSAAYEYVAERGLPALDQYTPYQDRQLTCLDGRVPPVTHISAHVNVTAHSVQALKVAIRRHAPTVVIIDSTAKSFQFYKRGVLYDDRCAKNVPEHAVVAVGWGSRGGEPHFILKNSWSAAWGDGGFVRVAAAANTCGVLSRPSYPRLERHDVDAAAATAQPDPAIP